MYCVSILESPKKWKEKKRERKNPIKQDNEGENDQRNPTVNEDLSGALTQTMRKMI